MGGRERGRESVCKREGERACVRERKRGRESVCEGKKERERECVRECV